MEIDPGERVALILMAILITLNSGLAIYQSQADIQSTAFIALTYVDLVVLLAWRVACRERPPPEGKPPGKGSRRLVAQVLEVSVVCLTMLLALALASQMGRILPPRTSALLLEVAAVAAVLLVVLHKHGWFSQPRQEATLPLVQPLPNH